MIYKEIIKRRLNSSLLFTISVSVFVILVSIILIFLPYSVLSRFCYIPCLREWMYNAFFQNSSPANYTQLIAVGTLVNTILTNSYDNILKSKDKRIHGFLYSDLHRRTHMFVNILRPYSISLVFITMILYVQGRMIRVLVIWICTAFITCLVLVLSLYVSQTSEHTIYKVLKRKFKNDFITSTSTNWKTALMRSMEFTLINPNQCTLTEWSDLEFFSLCFIDSWKEVISLLVTKEKMLLMEYELLWQNVELRTRLNEKDPYVSYSIALLQCADSLKHEVSKTLDYRRAYCYYLYSIFLFVFIYLVEEKRWTTLVRLINHAPSMPKWDEEMNEKYVHLLMLATLTSICEANFGEKDFRHIDYSVMQTIPYHYGMDLSTIQIKDDLIKEMTFIQWDGLSINNVT